jgi:hypothetical protein
MVMLYHGMLAWSRQELLLNPFAWLKTNDRCKIAVGYIHSVYISPWLWNRHVSIRIFVRCVRYYVLTRDHSRLRSSSRVAQQPE